MSGKTETESGLAGVTAHSDRQWLSYSDIETYCSLSRWSVLRAIQQGDLPASRVGTRVLVRRSDLDAWLESRKA